MLYEFIYVRFVFVTVFRFCYIHILQTAVFSVSVVFNFFFKTAVFVVFKNFEDCSFFFFVSDVFNFFLTNNYVRLHFLFLKTSVLNTVLQFLYTFSFMFRFTF